MKKKMIFALVTMGVLLITGCSDMDRSMKTWNSNISGGLDRTVSVYDYNGNLIKEYKGKIDVENSPFNDKILFDLNNKRVIINGGIVIIEEN